MPKARTFYEWEIPSSVVDIVRAVCVDYERRERMIWRTDIKDAAAVKCAELNGIVDRALDDVDVGIRNELFRDVIKGRGYESSPISPLLAKNTYYRYKRKLIHDIAVGMALI